MSNLKLNILKIFSLNLIILLSVVKPHSTNQLSTYLQIKWICYQVVFQMGFLRLTRRNQEKVSFCTCWWIIKHAFLLNKILTLFLGYSKRKIKYYKSEKSPCKKPSNLDQLLIGVLKKRRKSGTVKLLNKRLERFKSKKQQSFMVGLYLLS